MNRRQLLFSMAAALSTRTWADTPRRYALLYPDIPEPERGVFRLIREGIAASIAKNHGTLLEHALSPASTTTTVADILTGSTADVLITLGRIATSLTQQLHPQLPWITGATEIAVPTPGIGGISLVVSPDRVMDTLREVAPGIRRISVVLSPQRFGWLRPHMERAARSHSLQLAVYEADSISQAASHYLNILRYGNPQTDALWILEQGQYVTPDTLPRLIEDAWANNFVVFSNVLAHVSEGSLFALYMNPATLGSRLGTIAADIRDRAPPLILDQAPLRAINLRTARHLATVVDTGRLKGFDLTLGED